MKAFYKTLALFAICCVLAAQAACPALGAEDLSLIWSLGSIDDEIHRACVDERTDHVSFRLDADGRAGMNMSELTDAVWYCTYRWCKDGCRADLSEQSDKSVIITLTSLKLRDGIRMLYDQDLSAEEKQCKKEIQAAVNSILKTCPEGSIEAELAIYDYICGRLTYKNDGPTDSDGARLCTSTRYAFQNGYGNCQAYSDLFALMCSMAGIPTEIVSGDSNGSHAWNVVYLPGDPNDPDDFVTTLMVDVTYGDAANDVYPLPNHYYFNFGWDRAKERKLAENHYFFGIETKTDDALTYYSNSSADTGYATYSLDDAIQYCLWKGDQGRYYPEVLILNKTVSKAEFDEALKRLAGKKNFYISWNYYYHHADGNTVLRLVWNEYGKGGARK